MRRLWLCSWGAWDAGPVCGARAGRAWLFLVGSRSRGDGLGVAAFATRRMGWRGGWAGEEWGRFWSVPKRCLLTSLCVLCCGLRTRAGGRADKERDGWAQPPPFSAAFNRRFAPRFPRLQEREDGLTEWDRFARTEYLRLAMEEDAENDSEWICFEQPFCVSSNCRKFDSENVWRVPAAGDGGGRGK